MAQRAYRDRKDQTIHRLEKEVKESLKARNEVIQKVTDLVDLILERNLQEQGGPDFQARLDEFTDSILSHKANDDDAASRTDTPDGGASNASSDDPPITHGSWTLNSDSDPQAPVASPTVHAAERSPKQEEWSGHGSLAANASNHNPQGNLPAEMVTRPCSDNASFPAYVPAPDSPGFWMKREVRTIAAAEFSAQALALMSSNQEIKKMPFAVRLEQAVADRGAPLDVIGSPESPPLLSQAPAHLHEYMEALETYNHSPGFTEMSDAGYGGVQPDTTRWASERVRYRELWGQSLAQGQPHAHLDMKMENVHLDDEFAHYNNNHSLGPSTRNRDRALWGHPQTQGHTPQEEFLDVHDVETYLSDRGVHLDKARNTTQVEIDPNDFKGSFHVFADGRRASDSLRGSGDGSQFQRRSSLPAPMEGYHPNVSRAAATVNSQSINTMFTDMTATGTTDTGSYSANLCPAIPVGNWSKQKPGKALLTVDVLWLLKGMSSF